MWLVPYMQMELQSITVPSILSKRCSINYDGEQNKTVVKICLTKYNVIHCPTWAKFKHHLEDRKVS